MCVRARYTCTKSINATYYWIIWLVVNAGNEARTVPMTRIENIFMRRHHNRANMQEWGEYEKRNRHLQCDNWKPGKVWENKNGREQANEQSYAYHCLHYRFIIIIVSIILSNITYENVSVYVLWWQSTKGKSNNNNNEKETKKKIKEENNNNML